MPRSEVNRSGEMEVFVQAVELGGFSLAARALRMTPSAVSKLVARLERRLGARLINRSTRKLLLTAEGQAFLERAHRVLADLDEAERAVTAGAVPRGLVRVNCNVPFGLHRLLPLVPRFTAAHPEVRLDIVLTDRVIDLMDERADVAIRVGPMRPSQLMARKLGQSRMAVVAAPNYLARRGVPQTPYIWTPTIASPSTSRATSTSGLSSLTGPTCLCRLAAMLLQVTARFRAASLWPVRVSRDCPCSTSERTSRRDDLYRSWRPTIPATSRRSMSSMWATAAGCLRGCVP
jgi:DNA-binding transcriptional LysR family regulator